MDRHLEEMSENALHEATHAAAGWAAGGILRRVTIAGPVRDDVARERRTPCYCLVEFPQKKIGRPSFAEFRRRVMLHLAPGVSDLTSGEQLSYDTLHDVHELMLLLTWDDQQIRALSDDARHLLDGCEDWETAAKNFFLCHSEEVWPLLQTGQAKRAIGKLSDALLKNGELSGVEAARVLESAWGDSLPTAALPAEQHSVAGTRKNKTILEALIGVVRLQGECLELLDECRTTSEDEVEALKTVRKKILGRLFAVSEKATFFK